MAYEAGDLGWNIKGLTAHERLMFLKRLDAMYEEKRDWDVSHMKADNILCEILERMGLDEIVWAYHKVGKWYA